MNYYWTECPECGCQLTIQYSEHPDRLSGSVRRWSSDRSTNDGRRLELARADVLPGGGFRAACVCGAAIQVDPAKVERAATESPAG